jgi:uncharacterized protein YutE (UPF0331/DUF86 family)
MDIDPEIVAARLARARESLQLLNHARVAGKQAFLQDAVLRAATERGLQVAIEACLDIGHHIIARRGLPRPADYQDVFRILGQHQIIEGALATRLADAARFRNRLVHVYTDIDAEYVFRAASEDYRDLEEFLGSIVRTLGLA